VRFGRLVVAELRQLGLAELRPRCHFLLFFFKDMDFGVSDTYAEKLIEEGNDYDIFGHRLFEVDDDGKPKNKPSDKKKKEQRSSNGGGGWSDNNRGGDTEGRKLVKYDPNASFETLKVEKFSAFAPQVQRDGKGNIIEPPQLMRRRPPPRDNYKRKQQVIKKKPKKQIIVYEDSSSSEEIVIKRKQPNRSHAMKQYTYSNDDDDFERKMIMYISGIAAIIVAIMLIKPEGFSFTGGSQILPDFSNMVYMPEKNSLWEGQYGMSGGASITNSIPDYNNLPQSNFYRSFL